MAGPGLVTETVRVVGFDNQSREPGVLVDRGRSPQIFIPNSSLVGQHMLGDEIEISFSSKEPEYYVQEEGVIPSNGNASLMIAILAGLACPVLLWFALVRNESIDSPRRNGP